MKAFLKRAAAIAAIAFAFVSPVQASGVSDLWWNASESGWGVNVVGQSDTLFLTFFVYGQNGQPLWLVAPATKYQSRGAGGSIYSGPLYQTTGPWMGAAFNPGAVTASQVGTATFTWISVRTASINYSVNGTSVTKSLVRQTWDSNFYLPGSFLGGIVLDRVGCTGASRYESSMQFTVSFSGTTMQVAMQPSGGAACTASGPYYQEGSMTSFGGLGTGTSCASGATGTTNFYAIEATWPGITGMIEATYPGGCKETGRFAGVRRAD